MEELERLCDRIIILDKAKIIAEGTSDELKKKANTHEKITVELVNSDNVEIGELKKFDNISNVKLNMNTLIITYKTGKNNLSEITEYLSKKKIKYNKIFSERPTLNDVFLELTGKDLRD